MPAVILKRVGGMKEISDGVYLWARSEIIKEQLDWSDDDESKGLDFEGYAFWLTDNAGMKPRGFDSEVEALNEVTA
jgi:hypothetical protein